MIYISTIIASVILTELAYHMPFGTLLSSISAIYGKIFRVLGSRLISDHWKARSLLAYSTRQIKYFLALGLLLFFLALLFLLIDRILRFVFDVNILGFIMQGPGLILAIFSSISFVAMRRYFAK